MLNQRKHKKFNYKSRFCKDDALEEKTKYANIHEVSNGWDKTKRINSGKRKRTSLPLLLILLGIIIAILYYLETKIG